MTDNNQVIIQGKALTKNSNRNVNNEDELLKINSNSNNLLNKKIDSNAKISKNQSGIEMPSQNDSKIGLLGKGNNLFQNVNQNSLIKKKVSHNEFPNTNNSINNNKTPKNVGSINNSSRNDKDSFSSKSSSMSSKKSNKLGSQKIEKVKTFAEDMKYNNFKEDEKNESKNSFKKVSTQKEINNEKEIDDEEDYNYDNNANNDKKDFRRLTKREKIVNFLHDLICYIFLLIYFLICPK